MSLSNNNPNGKLYIGYVKWVRDNPNVMLFDSKTDRNNFFINSSDFVLVTDKLKGFNPNGTITLPFNLENSEKYNYIFYQNDSDISNQYYCCFINNCTISAINTTIIDVTLDIFQTYIYDVTFYKSFIERAHTHSDNIGEWVAPEPVSVSPQFERKIGAFENLDWSPQWVIHATSIKSGNNYIYSGRGNGSTLSTEYGIFVDTATDVQNVIKDYGRKSPSEIANDINISTGQQSWNEWLNDLFDGQALEKSLNALQTTTSIADLQDHRNELIGLYAVPKWLRNSDTQVYANQSVIEKTDTLTLPVNSLACGYTPKNKKLLTSLCKAYALYNENGYKKIFKPELFTTANPVLHLYGSQMAINGYLLHLEGYSNYSDSFSKMAYSAQSRIGYDSNTGLDKAINMLQSTVGTIGSIASTGANFAVGNVFGGVQGLSSLAQNSVNMVDSLGSRGVSTGSSGDIISITGSRPIPKMVDISPTKDECEYIDDFLSAYGYSIEEIHKPSLTSPIGWLNSRTNWNYIKTKEINLTFKACQDYINDMCDLFNKGLRIWHNYNNFGNLDLNNDIKGS